MTTVQSIWFDHKLSNNGWLTSRFNLMSWALSSYQLARFSTNVELVTDVIGANLATNLKLPYSNIKEDLETRKQQNFLWVSNKIYTYSIQRNPFIHVDTDFYFFNQIPSHLLTASLVTQNFEYDHDNYKYTYDEVCSYFSYIPDLITKDVYGRITASNAGIIGGINTDFYQQFSEFVDNFLSQNEMALSMCRYDYLNIFVEQFLFTQFAASKEISVKYLSPISFGPSCDYQMADFTKLPDDCMYIHVMNYKRNPTICEQMAQRLWLESPELYEQVITVCHQLEATHHPVSLPSPKSTQLGLFYRTQQLLHSLQLCEAHQNLTQAQLTQLIATIPESDIKLVIEDAFLYEVERQEFAELVATRSDYWKAWKLYSLQANELPNLPVQAYYKTQLRQTSYCVRLDAGWDWAEVNEFSGQTADRALIANLVTKPSYYEILLHYYPHNQLIREQKLDVLQMLILDMIDKPTTIKELFNTAIKQVLLYQSKIDKPQLKRSILSCVQHFLYHGVLEVCS